MDVDFGDDNGLETITPVSSIISHTYNVADNYTVNVTRMFNEIYSNDETLTIEVVVQQPITDIVIGANASSIWSPPAAVTFIVNEGSGQASPLTNLHCSWNTDPYTPSWTTYIGSFPFYMSTADNVPDLSQSQDTSLTLTGLCSNLITTNYSVSMDIDIFVDNITLLSFVVSDADWWLNVTEFTLMLDKRHSPVSYTYDMGDNSSCTLSNPGQSSNRSDCVFETSNDGSQVSLGYTYSTWGNFTVSVTASNRYAQFDTTKVVVANVMEWTCFPPILSLPYDVNINQSQFRDIRRAEADSIEVSWIENCMKTDLVSYDFKLYIVLSLI